MAGAQNTTGINNVFVGYNAGRNSTSGQANVFLGSLSGQNTTTGNGNAFIGYQAGYSNTTGGNNAFIGFGAGLSNSTGANNAFIGYQAGYTNTIGIDNAFIGTYAGLSNTTGSDNAFIGHAAGTFNTTGTGNAFVGTYAGYANTTGTGNAFVGIRAGQNTTTGGSNTFLGGGAGYGNTTGRQNTYLGQNAGYVGNNSGINNVFIGYGAGVNAAATVVSNAAAIGANAIVSQSNSIVLGSTGVNVGIGTSAPNSRLEITQGTANQSGIRLTNLTSNSPASATNQYKFLTVNTQGDIILGSLNSSAREGAEVELWQANGDYLQNVNSGGVIIGHEVNKRPVGYKLYVEDGILTEKIKVAVKNTADWSDKVFHKGYDLQSLDEVERYIKINQHLPGVPSAKEMVESGNDLHKTDAKLLEKIEELTLYMIELKKENEELRQQVNVLIKNGDKK
ncbi:hypothetical protein G8759_33975 [Spirosoma aureum]|uniref:TMF family protein n=1 Tax=Spirosoma aureum TaxID=2692134 RepID=A0A6G9B008_9BACT|nr:hypothetical protein G8759_33975 [Spirosoma aureum]